MASANFKKCTTRAVGQLQVHFDELLRKTKNHTNKHIDRELSKNNYYIGTDSWNEMKSSWKQRVKQVDTEAPPLRKTKDRITAVLVECPCPWEISNHKAFFELFNQTLIDFFGKENVHGLIVHADEIHTYLDENGKEKLSEIHCHGLVTPYTTWEDKTGARKGINGKNFMTKTMLKNFQTELNKRTLEQFGVELQTHGTAHHKTVEELKMQSAEIEKIESIKRELQAVKEEKEFAQEQAKASKVIADNLQKQVEQLKEKIKELLLKYGCAEEFVEFFKGFEKEKTKEHDGKTR